MLRRVGLAARTDQAARLGDLADDLFPHPPRAEVFQPEPGCSQPTFVGSASQVAALAGHLFTGTLAILAGHAAGRPVAPMSAFVVRLGTDLDQAPLPPARLGWSNDLSSVDRDSGYEVRVAAGALAELHAETRRGARLRGRAVETGGLLLGQIDDACRVVWVSVASGPPPDSRLSAQHFEHGIEGAQDLITHHDRATAGAARFVGLWHSHPDSPAAPSPTDRQGMADLLVPVAKAPRRALLAIVGGPSAQLVGVAGVGRTARGVRPAADTTSTNRGGQLPVSVADGQQGPGGRAATPSTVHAPKQRKLLVPAVVRSAGGAGPGVTGCATGCPSATTPPPPSDQQRGSATGGPGREAETP